MRSKGLLITGVIADMYGDEAVEKPSEIYFAVFHDSTTPADARVSSQAPGHLSLLTEIPIASLSDSDDETTIPATSAATEETSRDREPQRDRETPSGIFLEDIKACTGCGKNAMGDTNVIKCQNAHCSTEWVRV